jgi:GNAT superfamily N-acetyltransferase
MIAEVNMTIQIPLATGTDHKSTPAASPSPSPHPFSWLPIRSLGPRQRERIKTHLLDLDGTDRYLRFGYAASDGHIGRYVDQLDFEHDEVFGVFNRKLDLLAMAHLAYIGRDDQRPSSAEFGVSVVPRGRGRGMGARLFERACLHARNRGIDTLIVHALTENVAMLKIARGAGAQLERDGPDSTAILRLPPEDFGSHLTQLVEMQAGELDYNFKVHAARVNHLLQTMRSLAEGRTPPQLGDQ